MTNNTVSGNLLKDPVLDLQSTEKHSSEGLLNNQVVSTELNYSSGCITMLSKRLKKIGSQIALGLRMVNAIFIIKKYGRYILEKKSSKANKKQIVTAFGFENCFLLALSGDWKKALGTLTFQVFVDKNGKLNIVSEKNVKKE